MVYVINGHYVANDIALKPYEKVDVRCVAKADFEKGENYDFLVTINSGKRVLSTFSLKQKVDE